MCRRGNRREIGKGPYSDKLLPAGDLGHPDFRDGSGAANAHGRDRRMNEQAKLITDAGSIAVVAGTLIDWLPAVAALASLVWSLIRIYETKTVQNWIGEWRKR
jgi:hypothetical protein